MASLRYLHPLPHIPVVLVLLQPLPLLQPLQLWGPQIACNAPFTGSGLVYTTGQQQHGAQTTPMQPSALLSRLYQQNSLTCRFRSSFTHTHQAHRLLSQYPSVYIVLSTINAGNPCTKVGQTYNWVTLSYAPGELSTIVSFGGPTQAYDPANQPATPTSLQSGEAYVDIPVLAPPPGIFDIDPDWSNCVEGTNQGFDPPSVIQMGTAISPPNEAQPHPL